LLLSGHFLRQRLIVTPFCWRRSPYDVGFCFTAQIAGSARKIDAYIALAQLRGAKQNINSLHDFAKNTTSLAERRNRIVHDPWIVEGGLTEAHPKRFEITARRKLRSLLVDVPTVDVHKCASDIRDHKHQFDVLHERVIFEISTT
jgi:hypothetical protein